MNLLVTQKHVHACHCRFACRVVDVPSILLQKAIEAKDQKDSFNSKDTFNQNSEECQPFLQNIMKDAMLMCMKTIKKAEKNENLNTYKFKPELHERIENRGVTAGCHNAAVNIVSHSQKLTLKERMDWRKGLGKPTTKVSLPSGDTFDTRVISANEKHSLNNKLGTKSEAIVHPGMRSNLKIDYSKKCEEYSNFVTGKTKSIKTPWEKKI